MYIKPIIVFTLIAGIAEANKFNGVRGAIKKQDNAAASYSKEYEADTLDMVCSQKYNSNVV